MKPVFKLIFNFCLVLKLIYYKSKPISGLDIPSLYVFSCNTIVTDDVIEVLTSLVIPEAANREISATVVLKRMLQDLR